MGFFKRGKKEIEESPQPVIAAIIKNPVSSAIFQDILKENGIPCICRQDGADASVKLLFGGGIVPDYILVSEKNYEKARELYEVYLLTETDETDIEG